MKNDPKIILSRPKKVIFFLFNSVVLCLIFFLGAEIFVRSKGEEPFQKHRPDVQVEPGGKYFQKDKNLGYIHLPGEFKITIKDTFTFFTTHRKNTLRITHPPAADADFAQKDKIWIIGCSITHGWSLNDDETYPWLLQEKIPHYEIINFGISGYGTVHFLIQIEEALKTMKKPKLIILTYASFHDTRNTFSLVRRRIVYEWNFLGPVTQPYASLDQKGRLVLHQADDVVYSPWPFSSYSALINYLEKKYIQRVSSRLPHFAITQALIERIKQRCEKESIPLIVAGIKDNPHHKMKKMLQACDNLKIPTVDMSVDLTIKKYTNLPYDAHPSALANQIYAQKLFLFLEQNKFLK
ncbi:SGNH/GDSL hydrolase family protein [candidate division CSSED10-310 bacterium]|uniref:SGNH/GDSL hydrolase family protein n=1 Tax=candidate division CSSED10-310 bacterium TaxID=2855610 RepID=A0ABV6YZD6_UNCC1